MNTEVLAISIDSQFTHKVWQEQELSKLVEGGIPYPMLSDTGGTIGSLYGVYDEQEHVNIRGRFIVDADGNLQAIEILPPPVGRSVKELVRQLQALQHTQRTGEATTCDWVPGGTTLKPGPDLVGNVWKVWRPDISLD